MTLEKQSKIDISRYIEEGMNTIIFHPTICPLKLYVELIEPYTKNTCFDKEDEDDNN